MEIDDKPRLSIIILTIALILLFLSLVLNFVLYKYSEDLELQIRTYSDSYYAVIDALQGKE